MSRFPIVLNTRYTRPKVPSTRVVAMSPIVTGIAAPPGLARSSSTMSCEISMPWTSTPRSCSGRATRPVPIASSSAAPSPASSARNETVGASTAGSFIASEVASY